MKVLEGSYKEKYVFFSGFLRKTGKEVAALNLKDVNLDAVVIPEQQLAD